MSLLLQQLLAALAVVGCLLYSTWRLLTPRARLRALEALAWLPGARGSAWLAQLRARTLSRLASGCAACGGGDTRGAATPGAPAPNRTTGGPRR